MKREIIERSIQVGIEAREDGEKRHIAGLIPFDKESEDLGGFVEVIRKGAFAKTLKESNVRCLWAHNTQYVMGSTAAGTFSLEEREDGLHFDVTVPNTSWASDVFETVSRRDAPGVSFGFSVIKDSWDEGQEPAKRELLEVRLFEVSVGVAFPAYPDSDSDASIRAAFQKRGIDLGKIAEAFERVGDKESVESEEDRTLIRSAAESLSSLVKEQRDAEPEQNPEPSREPSAKDTYDSNERALQILEAEQYE